MWKHYNEVRFVNACEWMVQNKSNLQDAADKFGYSRTTFWRRVHTVCKEECPELYRDVLKLLEKNKHNGGRHKDGE